MSFLDLSLPNTDLSYSAIDGTLFENVVLTESNLNNLRVNVAKFINSDLNGMLIQNSDFTETYFENSNLNSLEIKDSTLDNITFDEKTIISEDLKSEIYLQTSLQPIEDYMDYLNRVIKNQLITYFGSIDENPLSNFY